ncbi:hypothetical protein AN218_14685 [Streptomyces nanshensis]|uniref:Phosphoadenosine phosphosulphate reductase domain-containing protein n=2 Tax=Streptomyces nanshensis TaxID=518642 RepID=A0A1E7L4D4_9ACTN|nr:hypothetical protein AN218_14685 [Streptomyces nanshensis]
MLHRVVTWARAAGCLHKVVVVHADLGESSEWPGVRELVARQAERYGVRFIAVEAEGGLYRLVEKRGKFPDSKNRLCTSQLKRDRLAPVITLLVQELGLSRQAVVVNFMGIRAEESAARRRKPELALDTRLGNGNRLVVTAHPILDMSETEVWQTIAQNGLEYHPAYDAGLPRLSCILCVLAGREWLIRAARLCLTLGLTHPQRYADLEARIGHTFQKKLSVAEIWAEAQRRGPLEDWERGDAIRRHLGEEAAAQYLRRLELAA